MTLELGEHLLLVHGCPLSVASVARRDHEESDAGTTRCRERPFSGGVLSEYDVARTEHPALAIRNHAFELALENDDPSSGRCHVSFPGGSVALLDYLLDEQDARRGERPRELERWHAVGDMLPLEIELDILEMRPTLVVGEGPHILHRRIVPDSPRTRRVICCHGGVGGGRRRECGGVVLSSVIRGRGDRPLPAHADRNRRFADRERAPNRVP
jgi:hypothetical protein